MALPVKIKVPIEISLPQYILNPYRGSAAGAPRYMIRRALNDSFVDLLKNYRKHFYAVPYVSEEGDIMFHVRIPSGAYKDNKLHYDVVFTFDKDDPRPLQYRKVKMFSNSPSFLFTYAYVYYHHDLMVDFLEPKMPMISLTRAPSIRNPFESLGFERSTYFAARYLIDGRALNEAYIEKHKRVWDSNAESKLLNEIANPNKIVELYEMGRRLTVQKPRKPMGPKETAEAKTEIQKFEKHAKRTRPKASGKVIPRAPRASISARKARKSR